MEKFASEALLTIKCAAALALVAIPAALLLRRGASPNRVPGVPERWPGWLVFLCICMVMFVLPSMLNQLGVSLGCFEFLKQSSPVGTLLKPSVQVSSDEEWNSIANSLRHNYVTLLVMPVVLVGLWLLKRQSGLIAYRPALLKPSVSSVCSALLLCWATYGLLAYLVNIGVQYLYINSGWQPSIHPIAKVGIFDGAGGWIIGLGACLVAPLFEELFFRRLLMPWAMRRRVRGLWLQSFTLLFSISAYLTIQRIEVLFVGLLLPLVQAFLFVYPEHVKRVHRLLRSTTFAANWATSSVFAMLHASVWPSPIALMILSMGLGFLVVRTGRWWAAVLCHSLFNFTSLMVLYASQGAFGAQFHISPS